MKFYFKVTFFLILTFKAYADCGNNDFSVSSVFPTIVDFTDTNQVSVNFTITLQPFTGGNTRDCFFYSYFNYGFYGTSFTNRNLRHETTSDTITFNVYSDSSYTTNSIIRLDSEASSDSHVILNPPYFPYSGTVQSLTKTFFAQLDAVPINSPAGVYSELLTLNIASRRRLNNFYNWALRTTRPIQFIYRIDKTLDISLSSSGGVFDPLATARLMNFGELDSFETQTAEVLINTNVGYRLSLSSQNNGSLRHSDFPDTVAYVFSVSGAPVSLAGSSTNPVVVSSSPGISPPGGFSVPLSVQIGSLTGGEPGGQYSDIVQFNIEAF